MKQLRIPLSKIEEVVLSLSNSSSTWEAICEEFPVYVPKDDKTE